MFMNNDLKIIKKKYGDWMSKLCRDFFASILEINELLSKLLLNNFNPSHDPYNDIVSNHFRVYCTFGRGRLNDCRVFFAVKKIY